MLLEMVGHTMRAHVAILFQMKRQSLSGHPQSMSAGPETDVKTQNYARLVLLLP